MPEQQTELKIQKPSVQYFEVIDGLRGSSMLMTIINHMFFLQVIKVPVVFAHFGLHGFFILSAFLISSILYKEKEKFGTYKPYVKNFYIKRALRILPVYFMYLGIVALLGLATKGTQLQQPLGIIYDLKHYGWMLATFTFNYRELYSWIIDESHLRCIFFPHLWSISLEEQFYLIIPTLIFFCKKETIKKIAVVLIVLYPFIRFFGYLYLKLDVKMLTSFGIEPLSALYDFFYRSSLFQFDAFMYGMMIPLVSYDNRKVLRWIVIVSFFSIVASQVYNIIDLANDSGKPVLQVISHADVIMRNGQFAYINTLYNILGATLFYYLLKFPDSFVNKPLRFSFFKNCGRIVYGIYVYHPLFVMLTLVLYNLFFKFISPTLADMFIIKFVADAIAIAFCFSTTYYVCKLSFYKFEMPFLLMKAKRSEQKKI
jgi:peptidoglycan/LPS O-acetylase OafA/YrhL